MDMIMLIVLLLEEKFHREKSFVEILVHCFLFFQQNLAQRMKSN